MHEYSETTSMLAYVRWVGALTDSGNGLKTFCQWGAHEVIDVSAIDRCISFFKLELSQYIIIDHEGQAMFQ